MYISWLDYQNWTLEVERSSRSTLTKRFIDILVTGCSEVGIAPHLGCGDRRIVPGHPDTGQIVRKSKEFLLATNEPGGYLMIGIRTPLK